MFKTFMTSAVLFAATVTVTSAATVSVSVTNPTNPLATFNEFAPGTARIVEEFTGAATPGGNKVDVVQSAQNRIDPDSNSLTTSVGVFTGLGGKGSGTSVTGDPELIQVRSGNNAGRFNVLNEGGNFLDSNDTFGFSWEIDMGVVSPTNFLKGLSFFITDASDAGANLRLSFGASPTAALQQIDLIKKQNNQTVNFYGITFSDHVRYALLEFRNIDPQNPGLNRTNDGFAISSATVHVAPIPVPPAMALMLTGLAGLAALRRRRAAA